MTSSSLLLPTQDINFNLEALACGGRHIRASPIHHHPPDSGRRARQRPHLGTAKVGLGWFNLIGSTNSKPSCRLIVCAALVLTRVTLIASALAYVVLASLGPGRQRRPRATRGSE